MVGYILTTDYGRVSRDREMIIIIPQRDAFYSQLVAQKEIYTQSFKGFHSLKAR